MKPIKTKLVVAYEPESSNTTRIHPGDIGELLSTMTEAQFESALRTCVQNVNIFYKSKGRRFQGLLSKHAIYMGQLLDRK